MGGLIGIVVLLVIIAGGVALVLYTEPGGRWAVNRSVELYNDAVPGRLTVRGFSGALASRLTLSDLTLSDGEGDVLIAAEAITLSWSPFDLLDKRIRHAELTVRSAVITLYDKDDRDPFGDLAFPGPQSAPPSPDFLGPDLPIDIQGRLHVDGFELNRVAAARTEPIVSNASITAEVSGNGHDAALAVSDATLALPQHDLEVDSLAFKASWRDPSATLEHLVLDTNWGSAAIDKAELDAKQLNGQARLDAVIREGRLSRTLPAWIGGDATVSLSLAGTPGAVSVTAVLGGPETANISVAVTGRAWPTVDLTAALDVHNLSPDAGAGLDTEVVAGKGSFSIQGNRYDTAHLKADFRCTECRMGSLGGLNVDLLADLMDGTGRARVSASGAGLDIDVSAALADWRPRGMTWRLAVPDLLESTDALKPLANVPMLRGSLEAEGTCRLEQGQLQCNGRADGRAIKTPVGACRRLKLTFGVAPLAPLVPFTSEVTLQRARLEKEVLGHIAFTAQGNLDRIETRIRGRLRGKNRLRAEVTFGTRLPMQVALRRLNATYKTLRLHLKRPQTVELTKTRVSLPDVAFDIAGGELALRGVLDWTGESDLRFDANRIDLNRLSLFLPGKRLDGVVGGTGRVRGPLEQLRGTLAVDAADLALDSHRIGNVRAEATYRPGRLRGSVTLNKGLAEELSASASLDVRLDSNTGTARVATGGTLEMRVLAKGLDLGALSPFVGEPMSGRVTVDGRFHRNGAEPALTLQAEADAVSWRSLRFGGVSCNLHSENGRARIDLRTGGAAFSSFSLLGSVPIKVDGNGIPSWSGEGEHSLELAATGIRIGPLKEAVSALTPSLETAKAPLTGRMNLQARLGGSLEFPRLDTHVDIQNAAWAGRPMGDIVANLDADRTGANLHAQVTQGVNRYADVKATVPITVNLKSRTYRWDPQQYHALDVRFHGVDSGLVKPFAALPDGLDFRVGGDLSGKGRFGAFSLTGGWRGTLGFLGFPLIPITGRLTADQDAQNIYAYSGPENTPLATLSVKTQLPASLLNEATRDPGAIPLDAELSIPELSLKRYAAILPPSLHNVKGQVRGTIRAKGTIGAPRIRGRLSVEAGEITVVPLNQRIRAIEFVAGLAGNSLTVDNLAFESGRGIGRGRLRGTFQEDGSLKGTGSMRVKDFPVVKPGLPEGLISTAVDAKVTHDENVTKVDVALSDTHIRLLSKTGSRSPEEVPSSPRIKMRVARKQTDPGAAAGTTSPQQKRTPHRLDLALSLKDPVAIRGDGVDMRWRGNLEVVTIGQRNAVKGGIQALPGRFNLLGNVFQIETGDVSFDKQGDLDPFVNLTAHADTPEAVVTAVIRGRLSRPDLTLRSDPPLTQYQIVALLITGKSDTTDRDDDANVEAQAASLLMSFNNPVLERRVYEKLGIDRASVGVGSSVEEPIVTVGKRVGQKVYLETEYHHNAPAGENTASGTVEYRLTPDWSLETSFGDAQKGEVGLFWQKRFDRKEKDDKATQNKPRLSEDKAAEKGENTK